MRTSKEKADAKRVSKILTRIIIVFFVICIAIGAWIFKDFISFWQQAKKDNPTEVVSSEGTNKDKSITEEKQDAAAERQDDNTEINTEQNKDNDKTTEQKDNTVTENETVKAEEKTSSYVTTTEYEENKDYFLASRSYQKYVNARFGYSIDYPTDFIKGRTPKENFGYTFYAKAWDAKIRVFGYNNWGKNTARQLYNRDVKQIKTGIKYKTLKSNWYVISWSANDTIYYKRINVGTGSINAFIMQYPKTQKMYYDPLVYQINQSFNPGDLSIEH